MPIKASWRPSTGIWCVIIDSRLVTLITVAAAIGISAISAVASPSLQSVALTADVPVDQRTASARDLGATTANATIHVGIVLPLRNQHGLQEFLKELYTPGSPEFHKYLRAGQFSELYGPAVSDYDEVASWVESQGLTVIPADTDHMVVYASGSSSQVENAFMTPIDNFLMGDGRTAYSNTKAPQVPEYVARRIVGIIGLNNLEAGQSSTASHFVGLPPIGSGPGGGLTPSDIKIAYGLDDVDLNGAGQTLGLVELDGYCPQDIHAYISHYKLPYPNLVNFTNFGATGVADGSDIQQEVTGDIEFMAALDPEASKIYVYEAKLDSADFALDCLKIAEDDIAECVSSSYYFLGPSQTEVLLENAAFIQMATQGQSMFTAAGDFGAYGTEASVPTVTDISSQPYICSVGGTSLSVTGPGGGYVDETTWNAAVLTFVAPYYLAGAGGGGVSDFWPKPDYQQGFGTSPTMRNIPDVALDSNPGYSYYVNGGFHVFVGTSAASPLWAAFTALVDQRLSEQRQPPIGFVNPALYSIATDPQLYDRDFHDVADRSTNLYYAAGPGYDNATGLGSFNGSNLLSDLASSRPAHGEMPYLSRHEESTLNLALPPGDAAHVFEPGVQLCSSPYAYDPATADFPTILGVSEFSGIIDVKPTTIDSLFGTTSFPFSPADTFNLGRAYFIDVPFGGLYVHELGTPPPASPFRIFLNAGWNYIGIPWTAPVPISSILACNTNSPTGLVSLDSQSGAALDVGPIYDFNIDATPNYQPLANSASLQPWMGYRVCASEDVTLFVPQP